MNDRAAFELTISKLVNSVGSPRRQIIRVVFDTGISVEMILSISTLSMSARTTTTERLIFSFAMINSFRIGILFADHPSIKV